MIRRTLLMLLVSALLVACQAVTEMLCRPAGAAAGQLVGVGYEGELCTNWGCRPLLRERRQWNEASNQAYAKCRTVVASRTR